ncbi:HNH endonuclease [Paraclostridium bifermentans]|uniref:HNH endonuclease n=1 Tax=Paraclostridium bifermentans TaxID=1490 RepID=A0AA44DJL3_PARBF|nr:ABC-three component system protein [Paraclostridium bifermentans]MBN8046925.1 HNH endonuclease [Paraclostridium bifermentans]NME09003.1 HNH endonuclease [Paraclostridium bifermentans]
MANDNNKKRIDIGANRKMLLHTEVDGICPLCTKPLMYKKNNKTHKFFEVAHIYPLNPTKEEEILLRDEELLSEDRNSDDNLIALCTDCHTRFDKPRTVDEYRQMVSLKKSLISKDKLRSSIFDNNIDDEIQAVLTMLTEEDIEENGEVKYTAKAVEEKLNDTIRPITKRKIKSNISIYYIVIKNKFIELDNINKNTFDIIANQIKTFYLKLERENNSQEEIFKKLSNWLNKKTMEYSPDACDIIISFFIQNCEVFK